MVDSLIVERLAVASVFPRGPMENINQWRPK